MTNFDFLKSDKQLAGRAVVDWMNAIRLLCTRIIAHGC